MFLQCAQECAHPIVTISVIQIRELIAPQAVSAKTAVFQKYASKIRLHQEIRRIRKCSRGLHLQVCGEVAERLKAAVC
jgi:hypothetical protein